MKFKFLLLLMFFNFAGAHEQQDDLKSIAPTTGLSLFQLESKWKNQKGDSVKLSELPSKPSLFILLYTGCKTACPLIVEDLKALIKNLNSSLPVKIETSLFSLDSYRETPQSLSAFAKARRLPSQWNLYTSDAKAVSELAAALGFRYKRLPSGEFIHSNVIYYLNSFGEVTAKKEGLKTSHKEFIQQIKNSLTNDNLSK